MPGLVQSLSENMVQSALSTVGSDERVLGAGQHHRLLIKPDAFHVSVLFQPTLAFLGMIADILPDGMESARSASEVLDEFVLKVYLPQLEEKISLLFHQAVSSRYICLGLSISGTDTAQVLMPFSLTSCRPGSVPSPF
jgi:exocyst complex component 4